MESLNLALADKDANLALFEERSSAMAVAHAELEDRHKDTLLGLRETQAKVGASGCLSWKALPCCAATSERHMAIVSLVYHLQFQCSTWGAVMK